MLFSTRLKKERINRKLSQSFVAKYLGVSQALVSYWEFGTREPSLQELVDICALFNKSADYFLGIKSD